MAKKTQQSDSLVSLAFRVPPEFHREFKTYAAAHSISMVELLEKAFEALKKAEKGGK
jgi:hypothetical protein